MCVCVCLQAEVAFGAPNRGKTKLSKSPTAGKGELTGKATATTASKREDRKRKAAADDEGPVEEGAESPSENEDADAVVRDPTAPFDMTADASATQLALIREAFAGDDIAIEEFATEKARIEEAVRAFDEGEQTIFFHAIFPRFSLSLSFSPSL